MQNTKHIEISEELCRRILARRYRTRLPSIRTLAAEFNTSVRTMCKSVRTLTRRGVVTPGNNGTLVNNQVPERLKNGIVNIVYYSLSNNFRKNDILLNELEKLVKKEGYVPVFSEVIDSEIFNNVEYWVNLQVEGHIFIYSTFYNFLLRQLNLQGVPYVVANWLPVNYGVQWVDFNHEQCWFGLVQQIIEHTNNNRIAIVFPMTLEKIDTGKRWLRERWLAIAEYFGLTDYFSNNSSCFTNDIEAAAEELAAMTTPPQIVICYHEKPQRLRLVFKKHGLPLQLVIRSDKHIEPGDWYFENANYARLAEETWKVFKEVLDGTSQSSRSHLVDYQPMINFNNTRRARKNTGLDAIKIPGERTEPPSEKK